MLSIWPLTIVMGVFSSCEAAAKKSRRCSPRASICSMSALRRRLASASELIAASSCRAIVFRLSARTASSSEPLTLQVPLKSSAAMLCALRLSCTTGRTSTREQTTAPSAAIIRITMASQGSSSAKAMVSSCPALMPAVTESV